MNPIDENGLLAAIQDPKQQHKAFEMMVKLYSPQLYAQIRRMVLYHDDADDILQNTFLKAWTSLSTFRGESKLSTWLYRIAFNETLAFLGKQKDNLALDDPEAAIVNQLMSDEYFDGDETEARLQAAVQSLPPKQRQVFTLKYFEEMKYEAISEILGTTVGGLKASYHLAVEKIEKFLTD